jgi:hypothetical protein
LDYAVASYLLGKNGSHTYLQFDAGDPAYSNEPSLSAPIGAPTEAYSKLDSGIYQRKLEEIARLGVVGRANNVPDHLPPGSDVANEFELPPSNRGRRIATATPSP